MYYIFSCRYFLDLPAVVNAALCLWLPLPQRLRCLLEDDIVTLPALSLIFRPLNVCTYRYLIRRAINYT